MPENNTVIKTLLVSSIILVLGILFTSCSNYLEWEGL